MTGLPYPNGGRHKAIPPRFCEQDAPCVSRSHRRSRPASNGPGGIEFEMCGIAGIVGRVNDTNRAALGRMSAAMVHRGPDGDGTWESPPDERGEGVLLAHRRLAILDLSPGRPQPMVDPVSGHALVFNGEIYNFRELRARAASARGHRFRIHRRHRGACSARLRTMGRGCVDAAARHVRLRALGRRARSGCCSRAIRSASSRSTTRSHGGDASLRLRDRALLALRAPDAPRSTRAALATTSSVRLRAGPHTLVAGIASCAPGHVLGSTRTAPSRRGATGDCCERLPDPARLDARWRGRRRRAASERVRRHLVSDVPLGVFLSGGVDSARWSRTWRRHAQRAGAHLHARLRGGRASTRPPPRARIAERIGTEHHEVRAHARRRSSRSWTGALDSLDQPTFDGINSYLHRRAPSGRPGSPWRSVGDRRRRALRRLYLLPRSARSAAGRGRWAGCRAIRSRRRGARLAAARSSAPGACRRRPAGPSSPTWSRRGDDLLALYQLAYALFLPDFQTAEPAASSPVRDGRPAGGAARASRSETVSRPPLSALSVLEQRLFLGERLLRDNDAASMAASIEQRLPLVDRVLFETSTACRRGQRYLPVGKKAALRRDRAARPRPGALRPPQERLRAALRALDPQGPERVMTRRSAIPRP